jgi:transposase
MNKNKLSYRGKEVFIGIDVHRGKYAVSAVVEGSYVDNFVYNGNESGLVEMLSKRYKEAQSIKSCYEAGFSGYSLHRFLEFSGFTSVLVHAGHVETSSSKRKTDKRDSKQMSYQLYSGSLKGINIPTAEEEDMRRFCRLRRNLIKERTRTRVRTRMLFNYYGILRSDFVGTLSYLGAQRIYVSNIENFGKGFKYEIGIYLDNWKSLSNQIRELDKEIKKQSEDSEIDKYYLSIPGIGLHTARVLATELGDMSRFSNVNQLYSYIGLTPSEFSSGEQRRLGHISREGKPIIRAMLIQAAWKAIKDDEYINTQYCRLKNKVGGKRAIVAVARRMIGIARYCATHKEFYKMTEIKEEKLAA